MARLSASHLDELLRLRHECNLILSFLRRASGLGWIGDAMSTAVANTYVAQDLKGLRVVARDLRDMAASADTNSQNALDALLRVQGFATASDLLADEKRVVEAIAERGMIRNETEYRAVEHLLANSAELPLQQVDALVALLAGYFQG